VYVYIHLHIHICLDAYVHPLSIYLSIQVYISIYNYTYLRPVDKVAGGSRLCRHRARDHCLSAAGRSVDQHAARGLYAHAREDLGVAHWQLDQLADFGQLYNTGGGVRPGLTQDILPLVFCVQESMPLQYPHYCNTIARLLRNIWPPPDPPFICHTPYNIGNDNIVLRLKTRSPTTRTKHEQTHKHPWGGALAT